MYRPALRPLLRSEIAMRRCLSQRDAERHIVSLHDHRNLWTPFTESQQQGRVRPHGIVIAVDPE
jgi:hypothetical protein